MRRAFVAIAVAVAGWALGVPAVATAAATEPAPVVTSDCALNAGLVRGWFGPPVEPVLRGAVLTGEVVVYGNIYCRSVTVTATIRPYFQITPWQYGAPTQCVPEPLSVGGTAGWCTFRTIQVYYPVGTMLPVDVEAAGVDDLGRPVTRRGFCWLTYYTWDGTYASCNPW